MANTQIAGADKGFGLDELNQWISEREQLLGPIVDIGDGGTKTAGEFDLHKPRLKGKFARVALRIGATCVSEAGFTPIKEGEAYIGGVLLPVCLARPS